MNALPTNSKNTTMRVRHHLIQHFQGEVKEQIEERRLRLLEDLEDVFRSVWDQQATAL